MADNDSGKKIIAAQIGDPFRQAIQNRVEAHESGSPGSQALPMSNDDYASLESKRVSAGDAKSKQIAEWAKQGLDENGDPIRKPKAQPSTTPSSGSAQEQ